MPLTKASPDRSAFNSAALLPYELRLSDFEDALRDLYDLLWDINNALTGRGLRRIEETVRAAIFSGILSDALSASLAKHSRILVVNGFHNGHPDLIPEGRYAHDAVSAGEEGVEVKATKGTGAVDTHGARNAWLCVFRYRVDSETEPALDRSPTLVTTIMLAELTLDDFRSNPRGLLGTRTASPNRAGLEKLRANAVYKL